MSFPRGIVTAFVSVERGHPWRYLYSQKHLPAAELHSKRRILISEGIDVLLMREDGGKRRDAKFHHEALAGWSWRQGIVD